jgi:hypothetical protein
MGIQLKVRNHFQNFIVIVINVESFQSKGGFAVVVTGMCRGDHKRTTDQIPLNFAENLVHQKRLPRNILKKKKKRHWDSVHGVEYFTTR